MPVYFMISLPLSLHYSLRCRLGVQYLKVFSFDNYEGKLADWDSRWDCLSMAVDDRNVEERNPTDPNYIPKSKYSSISTYISNSPMNRPEYNDVKFPRNTKIMDYAR